MQNTLPVLGHRRHQRASLFSVSCLPKPAHSFQLPLLVPSASSALLSRHPFLSKHFSAVSSTRSRSKSLSAEPPPSSCASSEFTERLFWNKRPGDFPVLMIVFEGALGDYYYESYWKSSSLKLRFRDSLLNGLLTLGKSYFIVILLTYSPQKNAELLRVLRKKQLPIDAVYAKTDPEVFELRQNYNQVVEDFRVRGTLSLLTAATKPVETIDQLYEPTASYSKKFPILYMPKDSKCLTKVYIVPHYRFSKRLKLKAVASRLLDQESFFQPVDIPTSCAHSEHFVLVKPAPKAQVKPPRPPKIKTYI